MTKVCQEAFVRKEPCINGKRNVKITNYLKENGKCRPYRSTSSLYCLSEKKQFCKCNVVDNLHYRTYDGQSIHFSGGCRYTLTRHNGRGDSCSFNIEIQNEYRNKNKHLTHTKSVIIHMFGEKFELGQNKTLKLGNIQRSIPYEKGEDVRIFHSNNVVQFIAPKCSVHVAFDVRSNAFIEVSKRYSKKMNGICGNCNGIEDDLKTKSGKDVSKKRDKYSRIANSYKVTGSGKYCKTAKHISYKSLCKRSFVKSANSRYLCSAIISRDSPFRKCGQQAHVDLRNFYEDCLIDMCVNKNRRQHPQRIQCKILGVLSEVCAESGIPGIKWRTLFNCPKKCGKNEHFSRKASPCPRTCENHFFGTRRPCYDLPEREGCECNTGYIRDGSLCVKPMHCNCINLCIDRKGSEKCRKWKAKGECKKFEELMNIMCRKTCNFCKELTLSCENEISTKRCLLFRRQGLCFDEFYRSICGLTCNPDKCKCSPNRVIFGKCNEKTYIITNTYYNYVRDSNGRCVKIVKQTYRLCCPPTWTDYGICNYCTGKLNITTYSYDHVKMKCVHRTNTRYENCRKCPENAREQRNCIDDKYLKTTVYFNRLNGCFQCFSDQRISITEIKCKTTKMVEMINQTTKCITICKRTSLNCQCSARCKRKCCKIKCPRSQTTKTCQNGRFVYRTLSYKHVCICIPQYSYRIQIPKCQPRKSEYGKCIKKKKRSRHYYLSVTEYSENVNANCKCVRKILNYERICQCGKPHQYKNCNRKIGMLSTFNVTYHLVERGKYFRCDKKIFVSSVSIDSSTKIETEIGVCKSNLKQTIKVYRKFRDGCEKRTVLVNTEERICGCKEKNIIRSICEFNCRINRQFKLILVNFQCVEILISVKEFPITCPNEYINETKCYDGKQNVTTTSYNKRNCQCEKEIVIKIKKCICKRRVISEKSLKCDLKTRQQIHITVSINEKCFHEQLVCRYVCICLPPIRRSHCSSISGRITTTTETFYFEKKKSECPSKLVSTIIKPNCNNVKVIKQKCGQERNYYQKITTIRQILSKEICACKTITTSIWKCCKLPNPIISTLCYGEYFLVVKRNYKFDQHRIKCIPHTTYRTKSINCPSIKVPVKTTYLPICKYKQTRFYYAIRNCKCKLREHSEIYYKCCHPRPRSPICVNHTKWVTTFTTCHLSSDRKHRRIFVRQVVQNISCRKSKEPRIKQINSCTIIIITDYYRVRNCRCEVHTEIVKRPICCRQPQINSSCLANKIWRITTTKFVNGKDGNCINQTSFVDNVKKCPPSYSIVCPCTQNGKLVSIKYHFYVTVNCQCKRRIFLIPCPCHKLPIKIKMGSCQPTNMMNIKIFQSVNVNEKCQWKLLKSYQDVCRVRCDPPITICVQHSIYRTITITCKLVTVPNQYPMHKVVKSQKVTDKIIECKKNYNYYGDCINYRKPLIQCVYRSRNCKCELSCRISSFIPCSCPRLDYCKTRCIKNAKYSICHKHKPGQVRCKVYFTSKIPIVETCSSKISTQCRNLNYPINNCYYKSCETSFYVYQDCRCVKRTETSVTFIRSRESIIQIRCIHNRKIMRITNFIVRHNRCDPVPYEKIINIECPRWKAIQSKKHGYIHYKITYYIIQNCKCIPRICHGPYFKKKCPFSKVKRRCYKNIQWVYTRIVRQIYFTHRRICPAAGSPFREQICIEKRNIRIQPVKCPFNYEIITCIVSKNIKITKKYYYKVVNCQCVKAVIIDRTRQCKECRKPITRVSPCGPLNENGIGYIQITTRYWKITRRNICQPHIETSQRIGCCRRSQSFNECVNGRTLFKTFNYEVAAQCKPRITIISESAPCYNNGRPNKWRIVWIYYCRRPGEYTIQYLERMKFNRTTCGCRRVGKSLKIDKCCRPCRYRTVCRHNNIIVTISHCQRSYKLKCLNFTREKSVKLKCPKPVKRVIGDCKGRVIRYRIVSYKSIHCRCVRIVKEYIQNKIRDVTKCINGMWITTHIYYDFYPHKCVPKKRILTSQISCPTVQTFKDIKINNCDFSRSYFKKIVSNCKCVDKLVRKEILHYKCCKKPIVSETCVKHNTRVIVVTNFNLLNFKCYPVRRATRFTVDCSHLKLQDRIKTGNCTFNLINYQAATKNCACYRVYKSIQYNLRNCCFPPYQYQSCDYNRGIFISIKGRYDLLEYKCILKLSTINNPVNCDGQICERRYGKCIGHTQTIELFCLKRQGCKCVKKLFRSLNVCCGPRKDSTWTNIGKCGERRKYYRLITIYALKLHYITNRCVPVVIKQQYQICDCPKSFEIKPCFNNIHIITRKVNYKINKPKNVCDKIIKESVSLVPGCHKTINITMNVRETTPDGWCIRTSKIITPVNCKCLQRIEENRFPCPCYKQVHVKYIKYCQNNNIIDETRSPRCRLYNIYWTIVRTITPILKCSHKEIIYSSAFHSFSRGRIRCCTRARYETHLQWYVENCVCKNRIINKRLVCIESLRPHQEESCLVSKINVINYSYTIIIGICRRNVNRRIINVPCPKQPKIVLSRCINNKYTITKTNYFYDNCQCRYRIETITCDCRCSKNSKVTKCSGNYFFNEVTTMYHRKDCKCLKTEKRKQIEPICPRFVSLSFGECKIRRRHSIYRKITSRHIRKDYGNCKCRVVDNVENKVCDCEKETTKRKVCINNNFVVQTWGWRINVRKNRCEEVIVKLDVNVIFCPPSTIDKVCNENFTRGKETTTKHKLINCKCIENRVVRSIPCRCDPKKVLVDRGVCRWNYKGHSIRIEIYSHKEARGKHCITVKERKPVICRCRRNKYFEFCSYNRFVRVSTTYKLVNNRCLRRNFVRNEYITCSKHVQRVETRCYRYGFKYIMFYGQTVHNCKCVRRRLQLQICRCRCPPNRILRRCDRSGKALINIHISYKHVGCVCKFTLTTNIQRIQCPSSNEIVSKCNEVRCKGYWFRTRKVTNYQSRHCICVPIVTTTKSICKVEEFKQVSISCDINKKLEIRKESSLIYKEGKCVQVIKEKRIPITCNNKWVLANRPRCYHFGIEIRIYERLYFNNCRCQVKRKVIRCACKCTGRSVVRKCEGNIIRKYIYRHELKHCKCGIKLIKVETNIIHCKSKVLKVGPCFEKNNYCVRNVEYLESVLINCQCVKTKRIVQKSCRSCCDSSSSTKTSCDECNKRFITKITSCIVNLYGRIQRISEVKSNDISCEVGTVCVSKNDCDYLTSTETLKCITKTIEKCECISKTEIIKKDSCMCGPPKLKVDPCNKASCTRGVYQILSKLVVLRNEKKICENVKTKLRDEICCCRKSKNTVECINNRLIKNTERYTFNEEKKTCDSRTTGNDITENCGPAMEEFPEICNRKTCRKNIKIIMRRLIECKCKTTVNIETELCCCPEDRTEITCVGNRWVTVTYKYTLNNAKTKCIMAVRKQSLEIKCPALETESFKLTKNNLQQCGKTVYKIHFCRCFPVFTPHPCPCSLNCPKDTVTESCIPEKGVFRTVNNNYKFNKEGCRCTVDIKTEDKQIKCAETPRNIITKAASVYENGIYDSVTTHIERRDNCECIKQSSTKFVLNICFDNYRKGGRLNDLYDYKCEKIPPLPPPPPPPCPDNSTNSLGNGKSEVTYYVIQNNKCEKKTTVVTCNECKIQYCAEESSSCDPSKCSEESVRATCPIKCGICVPCTSTDRDCETNPFDDKQYRRRGK